jgi:hypothetical protein
MFVTMTAPTAKKTNAQPAAALAEMGSTSSANGANVISISTFENLETEELQCPSHVVSCNNHGARSCYTFRIFVETASVRGAGTDKRIQLGANGVVQLRRVLNIVQDIGRLRAAAC